MQANQFSPTPQEVQQIKQANKLLPVLERTCYKCGHKPCPSCGDWCDNMLSDLTISGNWDGLDEDDVHNDGTISPPHACCDMTCSYL